MKMETFAGGVGGRIVAPALQTTLGDNFMIAFTCVPELLQGLAYVKALKPSTEMLAAIAAIVDELSTQPYLPGTDRLRFLKINRTVDRSGRLKVTGCDEPRVLAVLAAILVSMPDTFEVYLTGLAKSGIHVKVSMRGNSARLSVFDETLNVVFGRIQ
jgi:hypothetical protein